MLVASFTEVGNYTVGGLEPFTEYVFLVEACTSVGCNRSDVNSVVTLESGESLVCSVYMYMYCIWGGWDFRRENFHKFCGRSATCRSFFCEILVVPSTYTIGLEFCN